MTTREHSKDCILFSTADWDAPYWTNKQHTAQHLAQQGYRVLYVESVGLRAPNMSGRDLRRMWHRLCRGLRQPKQVQPNIWVLSPLTIPFKQSSRLVRFINQALVSLPIRLFMYRMRFDTPLIWTYHPFVQEIVATLRRGPLVYHCVDDLSAVPGIDSVGFNQEERLLLVDCAAVFVTSLALKAKCETLNKNTHYFPNVADIEHFGRALLSGAEPIEICEIPKPRVGYIGALSDYKVDFDLIRAVAKARLDWHWVIIGAEREGQNSKVMSDLRALSNVHFLGDKPYASLPSYLRAFDVATLPTLINDYTRSMFPMKYFEYLAAGVPVVSTPLEFTKYYRGGLLTAANAESFEKAIVQQLERGRFTRAESVQLVGDNTWTKRLLKMIEIIDNQL